MTRSRRLAVLGIVAAFLVTADARLGSTAEWQWSKGAGWSEGSGRPRASAGEQLRYAYSLEQKGEYYDAAKQYFLLIRVYADSEEAGIALQRLAKCLFEMEDYFRSYEALEQVIATYPHSGRMADLVAIEYKIGKKLETGKYGGLLDEGDPARRGRERAMQVFSSVFKHDPYGPYADDALLSIGNIRLFLGDPEQAKGSFRRLIKEFPKSPLIDHARLGITRCDVLLGKASSSEVERMVKEMRAKRPPPQEPRTQEVSKPAVEEAENLEESLNELEEAEGKKMWDAAHVYFRRGNTRSVKAGKFLLGELVRRYPKTTYAAQARQLLPAIEVPREGGRFKLPNLNLNPFAHKKKAPSFQTPQLRAEEIRGEVVTPPIPGVVGEAPGESVAMAEPKREGTASKPEAEPNDGGVGLNPGHGEDPQAPPVETPVLPEPPKPVPATVPVAPAPAPQSPAERRSSQHSGGWSIDLGEGNEGVRRSPTTPAPRPRDPEPLPASPAKPKVAAPERGGAGVEPVGSRGHVGAPPSSVPTRVGPKMPPASTEREQARPAPRPKPKSGGWQMSEDFE